MATNDTKIRQSQPGRKATGKAQMHRTRSEHLAAIVYGAAVGDALGVPFEFRDRDTFTCDGMAEGGAHRMPAGTFSDDTSLLIATCDSLRANHGKINIEDMRRRFRSWLYEGKYTVDGAAFDVGNATAVALDAGCGCTHERSNGNGSLMRIAPLALTDADDDQIRAVSAITHAHKLSTESCVAFVGILRQLLGGASLPRAIEENVPDDERFSFMLDIAKTPRSDVRSSGFVLDTLKASLWCALHTGNYRDCVLAAVNLGHDSDTTACVAGALAGALYGSRCIPAEWMAALRGKDVIDGCLFG
ncbi:MAG: ADP-ribosylglycohydrolase family protein [Eggerthellaceae bacterium]|nr:ADP-ribosylglycohydrolase family protein [Eggerthellaceae bacterium]